MLNKCSLSLILWALLSSLCIVASGQSQNTFSYSLPASARTSAGVYKQDGTLVKTLWSGVETAAGTYQVKWDGTNDFSQPVPVEDYIIKVVSNNVHYKWQGVIGNSSKNFYGNSVYKSLYPPNDIVIVGNKASYTVDFNEGQPANSQFDLSNPQERLTPYTFSTSNQATNFLCTDGTNYYYSTYDAYDPNLPSFVYATKIEDNSLVTFPEGVSHTVNQGATFPSVMAFRPEKAIISGIAASANFIFVARHSINRLDVFNKNGGIVQSIEINAPRAMFASNNDLWIITGSNTLKKYTVNSNGTLGTSSLSITGLTLPLNVKVNGSMLAVVDGGLSQQIKTFNTSNGAPIWTLGKLGGIYSSPLVTGDRFAFPTTVASDNVDGRGSVAFAADGSFWVVDPGNRRIQHFDENKNYLETIGWQDATRTCSVDPNNPSNVAGNLLQWEVDYTSPIQQSFKLKFNWAGKVRDNAYIKDLTTLANGKMYSLMRMSTGDQYELAELDPNYGIRYTGIVMAGYFNKLYPNGDIYNINGTALGQDQTWVKRSLLGFDANNNPLYSAIQTVLEIPGGDIKTARLSGPRISPFERTSSNILVAFRGDADRNEDGFPHLGGIDLNTGKYKWQSAFSTFKEYRGEFPSNGDFDVGNGIAENNGYYGNVALAVDRNIFYGFNGEFWKPNIAGQTNKWNHFYDNGMFIGQFGVTGDQYSPEHPEMAGNAFAPSIVKIGDDYFMYHNDENVHGGLSRWKISGLNTIQEQTISISSSFLKSDERPDLPGIDLMEGLPYRNTLQNHTAGWTRNPAVDEVGWIAKTNHTTYGKGKPLDLFIEAGNNNVTKTVSRDLGNYDGLDRWTFTGNIAMDQATIENHGYINSLVIKDNNGRIISKFEMNVPHYTFTGFYIKGNGNNIYTNTEHDYGNSVYGIVAKNQKLMISVDEKGVTFNYAGLSPITVPIYDNLANWKNPKTLQIICNNGTSRLGKVGMTLKHLRFIPSSQKTTPEPPIVVPEFTAKMIAAIHPLGESEIVVCENDGPYLPYTGQINVGNVSRPTGYWKFKIKSAPNRNESAVANSPEFTFITSPDAPAVIGDDVANTLTASHVLGNSEIVVSENGGAFTAYTSQINVGNVARAAGYWKFKIKAATNRNESAIANSPAFTVTVTPDAPTINGDDVANTLSASHALGNPEIFVSENSGAFTAYTSQINVGNVARAAGYWKFKIKAATNRNESAIANSPAFTVTVTPDAPTVMGDDVANTLSASHPLGNSEILVSENGGPFTTYSGQINVGNVARAAGFWKFKIKAATNRNEGALANSPAFTVTITPDAPTVMGDDVANTLSASHLLGNSEILVSENGGPFTTYSGQINVGNVARAAGFWKFKIKAATNRNEGALANSPAFTVAITPDAPTVMGDDVANTLSASHLLGNSEILVSENGGPFTTYTGQINVGNVARAAGFWKFKIKAATNRNESVLANSPAFTVTVTPDAPTINGDDVANRLTASHVLSNSEILVSENSGAFTAYTGQINVGNVARAAGYWKFKVKAATNRNESAIANSPAFTVTVTPDAPTIIGDDVANTLSASHALGNSEILVSENSGAFTAYAGQINVGNVARAAGYWKFKVKAATNRNESAITNSPAFTITVTPAAPSLFGDNMANLLTASHALGSSEIMVSENGASFVSYAGQITVGNVARPVGYWKFKIKAAPQRNESAIANSPAFAATVTPDAPTVVGDNLVNTLTVSHALGSSEIIVSENGRPFVPYTGQINVGDIARPAGYWKFKVKAALKRNESGVSLSPEFTKTITPDAPTLEVSNASNTLSASHPYGNTEILVSVNNGPFNAYVGTIHVGNVARPVGYWKFKVKAAQKRNESAIANSPQFAITTTVIAPTASFVLPAVLTEIKATQIGKEILVQWRATTEINVERYEIEKSNDGKDFKFLGSVRPKGGIVSDYNFTDAKPFTVENYYRIKTIDKSGETRYSKVVSIKFINLSEGLHVYPNPILNNSISIQSINIASGEYNVTLTTNTGQVVLRKLVQHTGGALSNTIAVSSSLAKGVYNLSVHGKDLNFTKRLVK